MIDERSYIARRRAELRAGLTTIAVDENTPLGGINVLANVKGRNLSITRINTKPVVDGGAAIAITNGTVALVDGLLTLTPTNAYTGPISFSYTVTDGKQVREGTVSGSVV